MEVAPAAPPSDPPDRPASPLRIALAHEWLGSRRGSEKTFEAMAGAFPTADLYALTREPGVPFDFGGRPVKTTFLDHPLVRRRRQLVLPLMPLAWRSVTRRSYDLVITSSHACVKGFWPARAAAHLCYCYTPMRYVWLPEIDQRSRGVSSRLTALPARGLREWDRRSVRWVDELAAISTTVQERIERFYRRPSEVIHPPVDTEFFTAAPAAGEGAAPGADFVLAVSQLLPYKRLDLAIEACHALRVPLVVAGGGPEEGRLRALAAGLGADVRFEISPPDERLRELYRSARALVFPGFEDFGIVLAEAQACGTPVVAYGQGGSRDIVVDGVTGALVPSQDRVLFAAALDGVLGSPPAAAECRRNAERFSTQHFVRRVRAWAASAAARHGLSLDVESHGASPR